MPELGMGRLSQAQFFWSKMVIKLLGYEDHSSETDEPLKMEQT